MVNTSSFEPRLDCYVLPNQCKHALYSDVPGRGGWPCVVRYDRRGRPVEYNVVEEYVMAEEDGVEE